MQKPTQPPEEEGKQSMHAEIVELRARLAEAEWLLHYVECLDIKWPEWQERRRAFLYGTADSASADCRCRREDGTTRFNINCCIHGKAP
jgi:hypothetical protein